MFHRERKGLVVVVVQLKVTFTFTKEVSTFVNPDLAYGIAF
jgi:hypothetical protein